MAQTRVVVTGMEKNSGHILVVGQTEFILYWVVGGGIEKNQIQLQIVVKQWHL